MYVFVLVILLILGADKPVEKNNPANTKEQIAQKKLVQPTPTAIPSAASQKPDSQANRDDNQAPTSDRTYKVQVEGTPPDWWMRLYVILNLFIASAAVFSLFLIRHQRDVMKDQLQAMRDQIAAMDTAREQTISQMLTAGQQTDRLLEQATASANAAHISAQAAQDTVNAMERSQRLAERAWLSPEILRIAGLHTDRRLEVWVKTVNTGRTPAIKANIGINITPAPKGTTPIFAFPDPTGYSTVIFPNSDWRNFTVWNFTDDELQKVQNNEIVIWMNGKVIYKDIFERAHWVKFCYRMQMPEGVFFGHSEHNEIDGNND